MYVYGVRCYAGASLGARDGRLIGNDVSEEFTYDGGAWPGSLGEHCVEVYVMNL